MKTFTLFFFLWLSQILYSQENWEKFEIMPANSNYPIKNVENLGVVTLNFETYTTYYIMSIDIIDNNFEVKKLSQYQINNSEGLHPTFFRILSDKYGCYFIIGSNEYPYENKNKRRIFSNIKNFDSIQDLSTEYKNDRILEFDERIYRFSYPDIFILDSSRNWKEFTKVDNQITNINKFGYLGDNLFLSSFDSLFEYNMTNKSLKLVDLGLTYSINNKINASDTNLIIFIKQNDKTKFFIFNSSNDEFKIDSFWRDNYYLQESNFYNNELYLTEIEGWVGEHSKRMSKYSPAYGLEKVFSLPGCINGFCIENDKIYVTMRNSINVYDLSGKLIKNIKYSYNENPITIDNNYFKVLNNNSFCYTYESNIFQYNTLSGESKIIFSSCTTANSYKFFKKGNVIYLINGYLNTTDDGNSWNINEDIEYINYNLYLGEEDCIYRTEDNSPYLSKKCKNEKEWKNIDGYFEPESGYISTALISMAYDKDLGILVQMPKGFYSSTDGGKKFKKVSGPLDFDYKKLSRSELFYWNGRLYSCNRLSLKINDSYISYHYFFNSSDKGKTWRRMDSGIQNTSIYHYCKDNLGNLYGADSNRIYIWKDISWIPVTPNFDEGKIFNMDVSENGTMFVYCGTNIIYRSKFPLSINENTETIKNKVTVIPNPATEKAQIRYYTNEPSFVNVSIYNLMGNKVSEINTENTEVGYQSVFIDCSMMISGKYLVKVQAKNFVDYTDIVICK